MIKFFELTVYRRMTQILRRDFVQKNDTDVSNGLFTEQFRYFEKS